MFIDAYQQKLKLPVIWTYRLFSILADAAADKMRKQIGMRILTEIP